MPIWPVPEAGEIMWCHFPDDVHPKPKPRPALVLAVKEDDLGLVFVRLAYGTSQRTNQLYSGEFLVARQTHPAAYKAAGLSFDTKFDLSNLVELPFNEDYFSVPPNAPHGQSPRLGTLHPTMVRIAAAAFAAARIN